MTKLKTCLLPALLAAATLITAHAKTIYVTPDGDDTANDGESWAAAYQTVTKAIAAATVDSGDEIWIVAGTHKEGVALTMKNGVGIYSGFVGTETAKSGRELSAPSQSEGAESSLPTVRNHPRRRQDSSRV